MTKYKLTESTIKRVTKSVVQLMAEDLHRYWTLELVTALVAEEDYHRPRGEAIRIVRMWIRDNRLNYVAAEIFENECCRAEGHAEAGSQLLDAIAVLAARRGEDRRRSAAVRQEIA